MTDRRGMPASAALTSGPRIMFTSVGRRNYLIDYFGQALAARGGLTIGVDASANAPALNAVDVPELVPPITSAGYADEILRLARKHRASAVFPLHDFDILFLAPIADRFKAAGIVPFFPPPAVALACADKWQTFQLLRSTGIATPRTWRTPGDVRNTGWAGPLVAKPRYGSASLGVTHLDVGHDVAGACAHLAGQLADGPLALLPHPAATGVVLQERLVGAEYGLDIVNDLDRRFRQAGLRRKLRMRSGETDQAESAPLTPRVLALAEQLSGLVRHRGLLDVDLFIEGDDITVLEMNPRFGGGYPFVHEAGMDSVSAIVAWLAGEPAEVPPAVPGVVVAKCDRLVIRRQTGELTHSGAAGSVRCAQPGPSA